VSSIRWLPPPGGLRVADQIAIDDFVLNETYETGYPHEAWTRLRREAPVYRARGVRPFWAITKHADVIAISKNPTLFQNAPRLALFPGLETEVPNNEPPPARHLINMDPPEHGQFRRLVSSRFAPRQLMPMAVEVEGITRNIFDEFAQGGCSRGPRCRRHRGAQRQRRSAPRAGTSPRGYKDAKIDSL